jgi:putative Ca2+/H+ antiporter (TMEM165/GDT1 family)
MRCDNRDVPLSTIVSTWAVIFFAELPDKTALAALVLATKFRPRDVIAGAWLAFVIQTAVAAAAGSVLHLLPSRPVHLASGFGFLAFAVLALRRDEEAALDVENKDVAIKSRSRAPAWLSSFLVVFAAEWGDLTQLATATLVARTGETLAVSIGAIGGLWTVTVIAATAGAQLTRFLTPAVLTRVSGGLFAVVGAVIIATALI